MKHAMIADQSATTDPIDLIPEHQRSKQRETEHGIVIDVGLDPGELYLLAVIHRATVKSWPRILQANFNTVADPGGMLPVVMATHGGINCLEAYSKMRGLTPRMIAGRLKVDRGLSASLFDGIASYSEAMEGLYVSVAESVFGEPPEHEAHNQIVFRGVMLLSWWKDRERAARDLAMIDRNMSAKPPDPDAPAVPKEPLPSRQELREARRRKAAKR